MKIDLFFTLTDLDGYQVSSLYIGKFLSKTGAKNYVQLNRKFFSFRGYFTMCVYQNDGSKIIERIPTFTEDK